MKTDPLDQWESKIVSYLKKTERWNVAGMLAIWGDRNDIGPNYPGLPRALASELIALVIRTGLMDAERLVTDIEPNRCRIYYGFNPAEDHWTRVLMVLASNLRNAPITKLPGYDHAAYQAKVEA